MRLRVRIIRTARGLKKEPQDKKHKVVVFSTPSCPLVQKNKTIFKTQWYNF